MVTQRSVDHYSSARGDVVRSVGSVVIVSIVGMNGLKNILLSPDSTNTKKRFVGRK